MDKIRPGPRAKTPRFVIRYVPAVLYHHDGVTVTSHFFQAYGRRYPVRELSRLRRVLRLREPARCHSLLTTLAVLTVVLAPAIVRSTPTPATAPWLGCAALTLAGLSYRLVRLRMRLRRQVCELWARFRGHPVRLFVTSDPAQFSQVCRALQRAREHAGS